MPRTLLSALLVLLAFSTATHAAPLPADYATRYQAEVKRTLALSPEELANYQSLLLAQLQDHKSDERPEFVLLVDRNPELQRLLVYIVGGASATFVGASPVSTGNVGRFDYYLTPLGVVEHTLLTDFRAQGTKNAKGVRGYGSKGMRIWDLGWVPATKGWKLKTGESGDIRLQMHATDPQLLEPRLGQRASKGCVRIPESLNRFLDQVGALDHAYDVEADAGRTPWVWHADHERNPYSGRFVVVIDTAEHPVGR